MEIGVDKPMRRIVKDVQYFLSTGFPRLIKQVVQMHFIRRSVIVQNRND